MRYILAIDQSTSATKAFLYDEDGVPRARNSLPHRQIISGGGMVSHDPMEIYRNTVDVVKGLVEDSGIGKSDIAALGISSQRETALVWDRTTGLQVNDAVVWHCVRGKPQCDRIAEFADEIQAITGLALSPYFSAAKIAWILENAVNAPANNLCAGTMDSWLIFKLTGGRVFATDYSNASRTQLFDINRLQWSSEACSLFGIDPAILPEIKYSDAYFGETDFEGLFERPIPIRSAMGDSHASLFGHGCIKPGMVKATYGTGSSIMMHIGGKPIFNNKGLATSLAWNMDGNAEYVLEGNINYSCAVMEWLVEIGLLASAKDAGAAAAKANPRDTTYLVPAFSGLGAPHWKSDAKAVLSGMTRTTGRAEIVRAAEECIAYQIYDIISIMREESGVAINELRADGGATKDRVLMQFQSDILDARVAAANYGELSAFGAAVAAGMAIGLYDKTVIGGGGHTTYAPAMDKELRNNKLAGWREALGRC